MFIRGSIAIERSIRAVFGTNVIVLPGTGITSTSLKDSESSLGSTPVRYLLHDGWSNANLAAPSTKSSVEDRAESLW
jgi:hypothetical protein